MTISNATCIADSRALLGEGPVWIAGERAVYWLDIEGCRIFRMEPERGVLENIDTPYRVGAIAPRASGGFIAGTDRGFATIDFRAKRFDIIVNPESDRPTNRFNDGQLDRAGRFWAGTMDDEERKDSGALYRLDPGMEWSRVDDGYRVTNGPAFSPDGRRMYHNDSARQRIYVFDLDEKGDAHNRQVLAQFGEGDGFPDGMTADAEGCLWVAFWDGWCLRRLAPDGDCLDTIDLPVQRPTSCTFGGPDLDQLFITSARTGLDENALAMQPYAGGLFLLKPGAKGLPERPFAG